MGEVELKSLAVFSVRQEAALNVCEARKDAAVSIIDALNQANAKRPWWKLGIF